MTFAIIGGLAGVAAGAAGIGGLTLATGGMLGLAAGGALGASQSARRAGNVQAQAAEQSGQLQREMFERQVELGRPYREAGEQALNRLIPLATEYTPFGMQQFQADPGYAFRLGEGQKALERTAAARGGLISGGALRAAQRYGQEMGSQEYTNAFNRYQAERQARLGPLQSLAGLGQTTSQQLGQAGQQMGMNVGETMTSGAAARASGYVGGANALTGAIGTGLNYYQGQNMLNALQRPGVGYKFGGFGGGGSAPQGFGQVNPASGEYMGSLEF